MKTNPAAVTPLENVKKHIANACHSVHPTRAITLIAVSKTWPPEKLVPLLDAGHCIFGENKLQELEVKAPALPDSLEWHYIGNIQKNKIRKILHYSNWLHSIDSEKLLLAVNRIAREENIKPNIFLQVNIDHEETKGGVPPDDVEKLIKVASELKYLCLKGLMCIPSFQKDPELTRPSFKRLKELRDHIQANTKISLPFLSMGMSNDYTIAIEEGATHIRVGSAIFGTRNYL